MQRVEGVGSAPRFFELESILGFALPTLSAKLRRLAGPFDNLALFSCSGQAKIEPAAEILSGVEGTRIRVGKPHRRFQLAGKTGPAPSASPWVTLKKEHAEAMIRAVIGPDGAPTFQSSVGGIPVYLDNFAIKYFAKGDRALRSRFLTALQQGADLLFSLNNAVELVGPQGHSAEAFKGFLDEIGPHWFPIEMDLTIVLDRESKGHDYSKRCFSGELLKAYFQARTSADVPGSGRVIDLSSDSFFKLGLFADWLRPHKDHFDAQRAKFDGILLNGVKKCRAKAVQGRNWLDYALPTQSDSAKLATFAYYSLMRNLIADRGDTLKEGDGSDFFHAVMASAYSTFAALDKHWKRRIENLPKPNRLARIYYEPELPQMVTDIEAAVSHLKSRGSAGAHSSPVLA